MLNRQEFEGSSVEQPKTPEQIDEWGEKLKTTLIEDGLNLADMLEEHEDPIPIETILDFMGDVRSFIELSDPEKAKVMEIFQTEFGFEPVKASELLVESYLNESVPGEPGQSKMKVNVFTTTQEGIFLNQYEYSDGEMGWSFGTKYHGNKK